MADIKDLLIGDSIQHANAIKQLTGMSKGMSDLLAEQMIQNEDKMIKNLIPLTSMADLLAEQMIQKEDEKKIKNLMPFFREIASSSSIMTDDIEKENKLLRKINSLSKELSETKKEKDVKEKITIELQTTLLEYKKQEEIKYLKGKLQKEAETKIKSDTKFFSNFTPGTSHNSFVLSIDIRLSTELMLNAKDPNKFADFISILCKKLTDLVIEHGGIFDKFTGDGILAFFPSFYSGDDAGYRAMLTAHNAITFFNEHYKKSRECFKVVIANTGLGAGIDYGEIQLVNIGESLSIVGNPVVYACRLSSTDAGTICINQPAYELINEKYKDQTTLEEIILDVKSSGQINVYQVKLKGKQITPSELPWKA